MEKTALSLKEKQEIILDILKDVDKFCRAAGIRYTISDGTMLGAVRHGGFIPWDDDADVLMPRTDFDRFVAEYRSDRFNLLYNTRGEEENFVYGYAKVADPGTYAVRNRKRTGYGMYIDIFPLDPLPEDKRERARYIHNVRSIHNRIYHRQRKDLLSVIKSYRHSLDWWWNRLNSVCNNSNYVESGLLGCLMNGDGGKTIVEERLFDSLVDIRFEDHDFLGLPDPHSYLAMIFGADYMTPKKWAHNLTVYRNE